MTLHPLTTKGGAFVLKLGLVFKNPEREDVRDFLIDNKHHIVYYYT